MLLNLRPHQLRPVQYNGSHPCDHGSQKSQWGKSQYPDQSSLSLIPKAGFVESLGAVHKVNLRKFCHDGFCLQFPQTQNASVMERTGQCHCLWAVSLSFPRPIQKPSVCFDSIFIPYLGQTGNLRTQPLVLSVLKLSLTCVQQQPIFIFSKLPISAREGHPFSAALGEVATPSGFRLHTPSCLNKHLPRACHAAQDPHTFFTMWITHCWTLSRPVVSSAENGMAHVMGSIACHQMGR